MVVEEVKNKKLRTRLASPALHVSDMFLLHTMCAHSDLMVQLF